MECFPLYGLVLMVLLAKSQETAIYVTVLDGDAVLHCADVEVTPESSYRVRWVKYAKHGSQTLLSKPLNPNVPDAERVEWRPDGKRNLSLWLSRVQPLDEGLYGCEIWRGWDRVNVRNTSLMLKECKSLQAVKVVKGAFVNLSCPLDDTMATLPGPIHVSWVMLKVDKPSPITSERAEVNGTSLSFRSVVEADASWYRCNYSLGGVHRCYDTNLQVQGQVLSHYKDSELPSKPVMESREQEDEEEDEEEVKEVQHSIKYLVAALTAIVVAMAAAAAGIFIHRRRNSHAAAPRARGFEAGANTSSYDEYENTDYAVYKHSSIYQDADQVGINSFKY